LVSLCEGVHDALEDMLLFMLLNGVAHLVEVDLEDVVLALEVLHQGVGGLEVCGGGVGVDELGAIAATGEDGIEDEIIVELNLVIIFTSPE
jgi:hypothetical protein